MSRVAFVTDSFLNPDGKMVGGAELHLKELALVAEKSGAEIRIFLPGREHRDFVVDGLPMTSLATDPTHIWAVALREAERLRYSHLHFQYLDRARRSPVVWVTATQHSAFWDIPFDAKYRRWYPYPPLAGMYLPLWRHYIKQHSFRALKGCRDVLCTDSSFLRIVQSDRPELRERLTVVPNFAGLEDSAQTTSGILGKYPALEELKSRGNILVLVPRNYSLSKGAQWMVDIALGVSSHVSLVWVGGSVPSPGAARYLKMIDAAYSSNAPVLKNRLVILGQVDHGLMADLYDVSDIVLVPTFAAEATSLAVVEAMLRGKPVVATNIGGLNDAIDDRVTGLLAKPTVQDITRKIESLVQNEGLRRAIGKRAQAMAELRFGRVLWTERVLEFMRENQWIDRAQ